MQFPPVGGRFGDDSVKHLLFNFANCHGSEGVEC
jgi:hypothetical protein